MLPASILSVTFGSLKRWLCVMKTIYILSFIFYTEILDVSSENNYYDGLIRYLKEDSKLYQVMFILNDTLKNKYPEMDSLVTEVGKHFPSLSISYSEMTKKLRKEYKMSLMRPRRTTLFVFLITDKSTINQFDKAKIQMRILSDKLPLPKLLIVYYLPLTDAKLKKTLQSFWRDDYFDIALLTHNQNRQMIFKRKLVEFPVLSQINQFTKNFSKEVISFKNRWFPNKLLNMNGYNLRFTYKIFQHFSSTEKYEVNLWKFANILEEVMNFKADIYKFSISKNNSQTNKEIAKLKAEMNLNMMPKSDEEIFHHGNLRISKIDSAKAVIPIKSNHTKDLDVSHEFWYMIFGTICTIFIIRLAAFL